MKQYHQGYGYELEAVLNKYPIKELSNDEEKVKLMKSLEKGNQHAVTLLLQGGSRCAGYPAWKSGRIAQKALPTL